MPTALLSVYDKSGLVSLAEGLKDLGWSLLATGGTLKALREAGLEVQEVADYTGAPECFEGRVKTLHPRIHGGLLFRREVPGHVADAERLGIPPIDLVVVNLYPFEATIARPGVSFEDCIEQIDIGGPSMLRSASKNHASVTVLTDPAQYGTFLEKTREGTWGPEDRRACALAAFQRTAAYDAAISAWMATRVGQDSEALPGRLSLGLALKEGLRYGENPHQPAAFYIRPGTASAGLDACEKLQGKELSFNNLLDADSAARTVFQFAAPACVIVKHSSPCGVGRGPHALEAFLKARASDTVSAFGGIVAFNRPVDVEVAQAMLQSFWEVVLAPAFSPQALEIFAARKQLRLLRTPAEWPVSSLDIRSVGGGYLVQRPDAAFSAVDNWQVKATGGGPRPLVEDLVLAQTVAKAVKSNAVVLAKDGATVGIGAGQMSRVDAVEAACRKAGERARGAVLGSDAYFPFPDGLKLAAQHGVSAFVEPGGSLRDQEVIEAAQRLGVWLFFTGMRHLRH